MTVPALVPTAVVSDWLGITPQALGDLHKRGVIPKAGRDRWDLKAAVTAYAGHMREAAAGRKSDADDDVDLVRERALLARSQREHQDMKNAELAGRLLPREQVDAAVTNTMAVVRAGLLRIPAKAATRFASKPAATIRTGLDDMIRDALTELADAAVIVTPQAPADADG